MKKKILLILSAVLISFSLASCGTSSNAEADNQDTTEISQETNDYNISEDDSTDDMEDNGSSSSNEYNEPEDEPADYTEEIAEDKTSDYTEEIIEDEPQTPASTDISPEDETEDSVWISKTGSKYHSKASCSGMKNPSEISLSEAENRGLEPCKKCY